MRSTSTAAASTRAAGASPRRPYVFIGRGRDFAWSLTSAGNDNTDQFLEQLCNPDGSSRTRASDALHVQGPVPRDDDSSTPGCLRAAAASPPTSSSSRRRCTGPVSGTVTVHGRPYAVARIAPRADESRRACSRHGGPGLQQGARAAAVLRRGQPVRDDVQLALPRQPQHRLLLLGTAADPRAGHRPEPPHARHRQVRLAGIPHAVPRIRTRSISAAAGILRTGTTSPRPAGAPPTTSALRRGAPRAALPGFRKRLQSPPGRRLDHEPRGDAGPARVRRCGRSSAAS